MKTPEQKNDEEQRSSHSTMTTAGERPVTNNKKTKVVSFPTEIVEDILSRLPVKSIFQSRSVSKTWLNLLSGSPFTKLHFTRATAGFFISAFDRVTHKSYYLTAANDGGPLTKVMTVDDGVARITGPSHLNGLMCFTSRTWASNSSRINSHAFVVNPTTRKVFQLPDMNSPSEYKLLGYLYGFDESRNEHKILLIKNVFKTETFEFMIFSMSSCSWREIFVEIVDGFDWQRLSGLMGGGVCVNGVVYTMLNDLSYDILAFDFVTEKFSVISLPEGVLPPDANQEGEVMGTIIVYRPAITRIDGCLGVVFHDRERSEYRVWLLRDCEKRVWVKETINFPKSWNDLVGRVPPTIDVNMDDEIVFCLGKVTENVVSIPVYNMKGKSFRSVQFILDDQFASPKTLSFCNICCYVETIFPLVDNWSKKSQGQSD